MKMSDIIPVNEPLLDGNEKKYLAECIDSGWVSSDGPFVKRFENAFASYIGVRHGVAVCNGTAALETAVAAIGIKTGDEVIMPSFTIISCAWSVIRCGGRPIFVDVEADTWNIDVSQIEQKITVKTKAIMVVHMYGHPVDMDPVLTLAKKYKLKVIEDAAEAHGAEYKGKKCGLLGDVAAFSFYANKIVTTGEGGMIVTNDTVIAERAMSYRNLAFCQERRFYHTEIGYNFRMTNLQAAVGLAQCERIDEFVAIKRRNAQVYTEALHSVPMLGLPVEKSWAKNVYWMYGVVLDEKSGWDATQVMVALEKQGIVTRPFFLGLHEQPVLMPYCDNMCTQYPVTERIARQGFYLPSGLTLTKDTLYKVAGNLKQCLSQLAR